MTVLRPNEDGDDQTPKQEIQEHKEELTVIRSDPQDILRSTEQTYPQGQERQAYVLAPMSTIET